MTDFAALQKQIRADPEGYRDEFLLQLRHFDASLQIFQSRPNEPAKDFVTLVRFVASVADAYPKETHSFLTDLLTLLDRHHEVLDPALRKAMVQSLMQLRQRRCVEMMTVLPLLFRLFSCKDKALRQMIFAFIVADVKTSNRQPHSQQHLNRQMKGFLLSTLRDNNEMIAKKALAILTDLWRRQVWHDVHTANVIASAVQHPNLTVMYAAVKFFLGYDLKDAEDDEDEDEEDAVRREAQICAEDVYSAQKKGTRSSRKRKMKKLKRVKTTMMRHARRRRQQLTEQFAAIQLLQDPYKIAETLFARARSGKVISKTRFAIIKLLSRIISVHRLVMLNFYPYLQKYLFPGGRDVLVVLAALVEGCHEMVPPDALEAVLRQLVDRFVHDHARPEVITIGLKTVREMCSRAPLIMNAELLSDLVLYRKFKDAEVRASAKGLVSLFREIAPDMLPKKERGRADVLFPAKPLEFGKSHVYERLEGAHLLERDRETVDESAVASEGESSSESVSDLETLDSSAEETNKDEETTSQPDKPQADPNSLTSLKKRLAQLKQKKHCQGSASIPGAANDAEEDSDAETSEKSASDEEMPLSDEESSEAAISESSPTSSQAVHKSDQAAEQKETSFIEMTEILGDEDFQRLQELKREEAVKHQLKKFGLLPGQERSTRLMEAAEADADDLLSHHQKRTHLSESSVNPTELLGKKRGKANKTERMLSILRGREEDRHPSKAESKNRKQGGLSNKEKIKRKSLPLKGRMAQAKKRRKVNAIKRKGRNFKGHVHKKHH